MAEETRPSEFELIAEVFAPLAAGYADAFGLLDDAATIAPAPGCKLVVTTDMVVAGRHFRDDEPGRDVARRLLRVNLSDLAAMGAWPLAYLLAIALPEALPMAWIRDFAAGLGEDQREFGITLIGGDTTATAGPVAATVTALGEVPESAVLRRGGARVDDLVCVSGTIGDAALGLLVAQGALRPADRAHAEALIERFRVPRPRVALGKALGGVASACADVSDGLVADLGHICAASGVGADIEADAVPLSAPARAVVDVDPSRIETVLTGGDDYELVFTISPEAADALAAAAGETATPVTRIGRVRAGAGVRVIGPDGGAVALGRAGYRHF